MAIPPAAALSPRCCPRRATRGYALLGLALGAQDLTAEAHAFGYDQMPPLDLPGVVASYFPTESYLAANPPFLAYSAIGQEDVSATALQNALVAAGVANGGTIMTPHSCPTSRVPRWHDHSSLQAFGLEDAAHRVTGSHGRAPHARRRD